MAYPSILQDQLETIIRRQLKLHGLSDGNSRKATHSDIIKTLIHMEGGRLDIELRRAGLAITPSAFIQRRHQISSTLLQDLLAEFAAQQTEVETFHGYRVCAIDGSSVNIARDPQAPTFALNPSTPKGYNQIKVNALYDVLNQLYISCEIQPQPEQDEIGALEFLLTWYDIDGKVLLLGDRGYSSYSLFATIQERPNTDFLIRIKQGRGAMKCVADLPMEEFDREVGFTITTTQTKEDKEKGYIFLQTHKNPKQTYSANTRAGRWNRPSPYPMKLRIVRVKLSTGELETLATSLPKSITASQIKELYHARWEIETAYRALKYNGLVHIHGKSGEFAHQEVYAAMIASNFCSMIVNKIGLQRWKNGKMWQIDLKRANILCREYLRTPGADGEQLMRDIAKRTELVRPGRQNLRNLRVQSWRGFTYRVPS